MGHWQGRHRAGAGVPGREDQAIVKEQLGIRARNDMGGWTDCGGTMNIKLRNCFMLRAVGGKEGLGAKFQR